MLDSFKVKKTGPARAWQHCNRCGHHTIHKVVVAYEGKWDDDEAGLFGGEEHRILKCGGCDSVIYSVSSWDSEAWDTDENGETIFKPTTKVFPAPQVKKIDTDHLFSLPRKIYRVLEETLRAQSDNSLILATVGLRILIEQICKESNCAGTNLEQRIADLHAKGSISAEEADLFQKVRTFGNKGAHLGEGMNIDQIASGLEISVHLLEELFVNPAKKKDMLQKAAKSLGTADDLP